MTSDTKSEMADRFRGPPYCDSMIALVALAIVVTQFLPH